MNLEDFKFGIEIQMRWKDLDALGHVNNATYLTYLEIARSQYIMAACPEWNWQKDMFLIANVNLNFIKEIKLTDQHVKVLVRMSSMGNKSFVLEYGIVSEFEGTQVQHAFGMTTQIMFDMKERKSIAIPDWIRTLLTSYEAKEL